MKTYNNLYERLWSFENLQSAYEKARRHKTTNKDVQQFHEHWRFHLCTLMRELRTQNYVPHPLKKFVLRDPKTRVICVSEFRDRVVHHALINILQPIFEPRFIHDSYASRKGKGTSAALKRFDQFLRKVTSNGQLVPNAKNNNCVRGYVLKADIKQYFQTVDHDVLLNIINRAIKDKQILNLIRGILQNYNSGTPKKGMPLGNWTSQFFANVYLNELDQFLKHKLRVRYYLRYVDDFIILHARKEMLEEYKQEVLEFLRSLKLELHPEKSFIAPLGQGTTLLGFRVFYCYKVIRQKNVRKIKTRLEELLKAYSKCICSREHMINVLEGWNAYALQGNTYNLRRKLQASIRSQLHAAIAGNTVP